LAKLLERKSGDPSGELPKRDMSINS
jgi:hypothetical protein